MVIQNKEYGYQRLALVAYTWSRYKQQDKDRFQYVLYCKQLYQR